MFLKIAFVNTVSCLPGKPGKDRFRVTPNSILPQFIEDYESNAEGKGNEEEFDRNSMSSEYCLEPWNIAEENSNNKSADRGEKYIDILRWRVLERAQSAASSCEQIAPLHDNQGEEIYTLCLIEEIICQTRPSATSSSKGYKGKPLCLQVPERHGTSTQRFEDPEEEICVHEKPPVYQSISLDVSWFPK